MRTQVAVAIYTEVDGEKKLDVSKEFSGATMLALQQMLDQQSKPILTAPQRPR